MRVESKLFLFLFVFYVVVGLIYGFWSGWNEMAGVVVLFLTAGMAIMIGGYLMATARKLGPRPDDDPEGEISAIEGDYGHFSPHSWAPLLLAGVGALIFLGAAVGWWMVILAVPLLPIAVSYWVFEYFRGEHAI